MHTDDAEVHFAEATQPLPIGADRMRATLARAGFVKAANGLGRSVFPSNHLLALVAHAALIPLDRFQQTL